VAITVAPDRRSRPRWPPAVSGDLRAQAHHLVDVHEAVFEDGLGHHAGAFGHQFSAMNWACMSVGKPGYSVVRKLGLERR
jgi:hypothetical protein